ncbi:MAG: serine/threonine-protein kinase [Rubripirellula sp.]
MNHSQSAGTCNPSQIEAFLQDKLDRSEEHALIQHLGQCNACRTLMEASAAEERTWDDASLYLEDQAFDSILLSSAGDGSEYDRQASESVQINSVLGVLSPTDDPNMLGRLGTYEVSGVIGAGGMGVVLKGHDRSLDRTIAIKVLAPHLATSGAARKRFARESKAAAAVIHPNVIAIHGVSNDAALPYLVMPYIRGLSLQRRLDQQGPLEPAEILRIGHQVAGGLAAAHAQGLVHRDIKPANILLADGVERVAITDFGLARAVDDATMTRSGVIAGTPQYMSPEQAKGEAIDARSDLFSLGSMMYAMCTGHPPFRAETSFGVLRRITDDEPRDIRESNPNIPAWLCRLIGMLLQKNSDARFQNAGEVERILHACMAHLEQPSTQPLPDLLCETPPKYPRLGKWLACAAVFTVLAISAAAFTFPWDGPSNTDAKPRQATQVSPEHNPVVPETMDLRWDDEINESIQEIEMTLEDLEQSTRP